MPASTTLQVALAFSVVLNMLQLMLKYKDATRWRAVRVFKLALDQVLEAAGPGSTYAFTMAVNGASMQLRPSLSAATGQLTRATWLQRHADPSHFRIDFQGYKFTHGPKGFVMIDCAVFYDDSDEPFEQINVRRHHLSLFQVEGQLTSAEKMQLPLLHGQEAVGRKLHSNTGNPCKTSLLVDVPNALLEQLDIFMDSVGPHCQWAATTARGTKLHVAL